MWIALGQDDARPAACRRNGGAESSWTTSDDQKKVAEAYIAQLNAAKVYARPIVTKVAALSGFFPAEAYHQDYLTLHPNQPYIAYNDLPKIENLKRLFADNYIEKPTLVSAAKATN